MQADTLEGGKIFCLSFQPKVELNGYLWELFVKKQGMPSSRNLLSAYSCLIGIGTPRKKKSKSEIILRVKSYLR